jgi:predicted esterase
MVLIEDVYDSAKLLQVVIDNELKMVDENHMIIGGFSQGCAMSLHMAFSLKRKWAEAISLFACFVVSIITNDQLFSAIYMALLVSNNNFCNNPI